MNNKKKGTHSRRRFLLLGILSGIVGKAAGQPEEAPPAEKVKMLTPDGQLVEVDKAILKKASNRQKVSIKDILKWRQPPKSA